MAGFKATYLQANQAWAVTWGEQIIRLEGFPGIFTYKADLDYALKVRGLKRSGTNITTA